MSFTFQRVNALRLLLRKFNENHDPATGEFAPAGGLAASYGSSSLIHDGKGGYHVQDSESREVGKIGTVQHNGVNWTGTHSGTGKTFTADSPIDAGEQVSKYNHSTQGEKYNDEGLDFLLASDEGGQR